MCGGVIRVQRDGACETGLRVASFVRVGGDFGERSVAFRVEVNSTLGGGSRQWNDLCTGTYPVPRAALTVSRMSQGRNLSRSCTGPRPTTATETLPDPNEGKPLRFALCIGRRFYRRKTDMSSSIQAR